MCEAVRWESFRIDWRFNFFQTFTTIAAGAVSERNVFSSQQQTLRRGKAEDTGENVSLSCKLCPRQQRKAACLTEPGGTLDWDRMKDYEAHPEDLKPTRTPEGLLPWLITSKVKSDFTLFDCKMRQNIHSLFYVFWKASCFTNPSGTEPDIYVRYKI